MRIHKRSRSDMVLRFMDGAVDGFFRYVYSLSHGILGGNISLDDWLFSVAGAASGVLSVFPRLGIDKFIGAFLMLPPPVIVSLHVGNSGTGTVKDPDISPEHVISILCLVIFSIVHSTLVLIPIFPVELPTLLPPSKPIWGFPSVEIESLP